MNGRNSACAISNPKSMLNTITIILLISNLLYYKFFIVAHYTIN